MAEKPGILQRLRAASAALIQSPQPSRNLPAVRRKPSMPALHVSRAPVRRISKRSLGGFGPGFYATDPQGWTIVRGDNPTHYQATGRNVRVLGWERHPIVNACCRLIANVAAPIPWEAVKTDASGDLDGDVEIIEKSPAADLLNNPRPNTQLSGQRHRAQTVLYRELYGNAFWFLDRTTNGSGFDGPESRLPNALWLVQPENLQYLYLDPITLEAGAYLWRDRTGRSHLVPATDMVQFCDLNGSDTLFGYPRAAAALQGIVTDNEASQYVREIFANHGLPGAVLKFPSPTTDEDMDAAEERYRERMIARGGRGGVIAMRDIETLEAVAFNPQQMAFPDVRAINREDICAAFGIDPRLVSSASAKGQEAAFSGEQYAEARFRLVQQTVRPILSALEADVNTWLTPEFGEVRVRFNRAILAKVTEDITETSTRTLAQVKERVISVEEWRESNGYPKEMVPAEILLGGATGRDFTVADRTTLEPSAVTLRETAQVAAPTGEEVLPVDEPKAGPDAGAGGGGGRAQGRVMTRAQRATLTADQRVALWQHFDSRATKLETPFHREAMVQFHVEQSGVRATFDQAAGNRAGGDDPFIAAALERIRADYAPGGSYHDNWLERYRKLIADTFQTAGDNIMAGSGVDFTLQNPQVQTAIAMRAKKLADYVTEATSTQITDVVKAGRQAGLGLKQIADAVNETVFAGQAEERSKLIARTESAGALNQGEYVSALASGVFQTKEWLTQGDDRVRESHVILNGEQRAMDEEFAPGLQHPGDQNADAEEVINCRCSLLYLTD